MNPQPPPPLPQLPELFNYPKQLPLNTNSLPTPEDALLIRDALAEADRAISLIDDQIISEQTDYIHRLVEEQDRIKTLKKHHARLISPMLSIPPEIWAEIFRFACAPYLTASRVPLGSGPPPADSLLPWSPILTLTRVCVNWRDIMHSLPDMWCRPLLRESCLALPGNGYYTSVSARLSTLLSAIRSSGVQPLHITFSLNRDIPPSMWFIERAMRVLVQHHHRWKQLDIFDHEGQEMTKVFSSCISSLPGTAVLPLLETLHFGWWPSFDDDESAPPVEFPQLHDDQVPKLRTAWFGGRCPTAPDCLPWGQLQHVAFSKILPSDCFLVISELVKAITISITWDNNSQLHDFDPSIKPSMNLAYILPCLEGLDITRWDNLIFDTAIMPKLRRIRLGAASPNVLMAVGHLIHRSACRINTVSCRFQQPNTQRVSHMPESPISRVPTFFAVTPYMRVLVLHCQPLTVEDKIGLLELLTRKRPLTENIPRPMYCPFLYIAQLDWSFWKEPVLPFTLDMLGMRWECNQALLAAGSAVAGLRVTGPADMGRKAWTRFVTDEAMRKSFERLNEMEKDGLKLMFPAG